MSVVIAPSNHFSVVLMVSRWDQEIFCGAAFAQRDEPEVPKRGCESQYNSYPG